MGLRTGAYATIWSVENKGNFSNVRVSISKKNRSTGAYEQDFSGYIRFIGEAHKNASTLNERDRIKVGEFEVTTNYDANRKTTYTNYALFSFELPDGSPKSAPQPLQKYDADLPDTEEDPF